MARLMIAMMVIAVACGCSLFKGKKTDAEAAGDQQAVAEKAAPAEKKAAPVEKKAAPVEKKVAEEPKAPAPAKVEVKPAAPVKTTGTLALTVNVKAAEVYVDDVLFGQIRKAGDEQDFIVAGGKRELVVKKFGYEDYRATIGLEAGGVNTLAVELKRVPVKPVDVSAPKAAQ